MSEFNFEEEVAIDLDDLHEEWRSHSQIRKKYADQVAYLEQVKKKIHERLKVRRSELIKEAKEDHGASNASLQEAYYRQHKDHKGLKEELIEAEYQLSMAWNALHAFDDRKSALENEVKLWLSNYYSTPRETREIKPGKRLSEKDKEEIVEKSRKAVNVQRRHRK